MAKFVLTKHDYTVKGHSPKISAFFFDLYFNYSLKIYIFTSVIPIVAQ